MDVEIDVHDAMTGVAGACRRERDIVVDTEARRVTGHRVVQAAGRVEGVLDLPFEDPIDTLERTTHDPGRCLEHVVESRAVARADTGRTVRLPRVGAAAAHGGDSVARILVRGL